MFIDEIFKCSAGALNETLAFLNERLYHPENGGPPLACPLIAAITASNPTGEETAAIYDRLLVRLEVGYLADPSNFAALVHSAVTPLAPPRRTTVDLAALRQAVQTAVPALASAPGALAAITCWPPSDGDCRPGRAPWPGQYLGLAGRAEGPHARARSRRTLGLSMRMRFTVISSISRHVPGLVMA